MTTPGAFFLGAVFGQAVSFLLDRLLTWLNVRYEAKSKHALVEKADAELLSRFVALAQVDREAKKRGCHFTEKQ